MPSIIIIHDKINYRRSNYNKIKNYVALIIIIEYLNVMSCVNSVFCSLILFPTCTVNFQTLTHS